MIHEKLEHKKIGSVIGILYVLMLAVAVFALYVFIHFIAFITGIPWIVYVLYALMIVAATLIIKVRLTDYSYGIARGELVLDRCISRNPKNVLTLRIKDILWFGDCGSVPAEYAGVKRGKLTFLKSNVSKTVVYKSGKFTHAVMITPSEKFCAELTSRMEKYLAGDKKDHEEDDEGQTSEE